MDDWYSGILTGILFGIMAGLLIMSVYGIVSGVSQASQVCEELGMIDRINWYDCLKIDENQELQDICRIVNNNPPIVDCDFYER